MTLAKKIVTGAGWTTSSAYLNAVISFAGNIFLARILVPDDFGVFTLAASFLSLLFMLAGFGSQESIIQCRDETIKDLIPTAFWMTLGLGLGLAVAGSMLGFILMPRYGQTVGILIVLLSWFNLLSMISNAYGAILKRELIYKPLALIQTAGTFISFGLAVVLAYYKWGIWSLFVREAIWIVLVLGGVAWASGYRLQFRFDRKAAGWIWSYGWKILGNRVGDVLFERVDKLVVGGLLGTSILGQYSIAYRLALTGHQFGYGVVHSVVFSAFSAIQKDTQKLQAFLEKLYFLLFRLVLLLGLLVWFCGSNLVILIYGPKWQLAGTIFQSMAIFLAAFPLETSLRVFLISSGHINSALRIRIWQLCFFLPSVLIAAYFGDVLWVVWSINASIFISWLLAMYSVSHVVAIRWRYLMQKPLVAGCIVFAFMAAINNSGFMEYSAMISVLLQGILVGSIMISALYLMERRSLYAEWNMIRASLMSG